MIEVINVKKNLTLTYKPDTDGDNKTDEEYLLYLERVMSTIMSYDDFKEMTSQ